MKGGITAQHHHFALIACLRQHRQRTVVLGVTQDRLIKKKQLVNIGQNRLHHGIGMLTHDYLMTTPQHGLTQLSLPDLRTRPKQQ